MCQPVRRNRYPKMTSNKVFIACLLLLIPSLSLALPEDWQQEMIIDADDFVGEIKEGVILYKGNVVVTQGTMKIEADRLTLIKNGNQFEKAIIEGEQAYYEQQIEAEQPLSKAYSNRMDFFMLDKRTIFRGDAKLEQQGNTIWGDWISYDMNTEKVEASGQQPDDNETSPSNGRIRVIIQPQSLPESESE